MPMIPRSPVAQALGVVYLRAVTQNSASVVTAAIMSYTRIRDNLVGDVLVLHIHLSHP